MYPKILVLLGGLTATIFAVDLGAQTAAAPSPPRPTNFGAIKAACVIGDVSAVNQETQEVVPLHNDDLLFQHYAIKTSANSSIVLVFSNGSTVRLGASAELVIHEFLQDPFAESGLAMNGLKQEPVPSSTKLRLERGELTGHVTKLHRDSTYNVEMPCGVAGIRGTTFRHVYRPNANGGGLFSAATSEGTVVFTGPDGKEVPVPSDVELSGRVRPRGGFATFDTNPLSPRTATIMEHHAKVMVQQAQRVVFRKSDVGSTRGPKPVLKRDPQAKRETVDDTKDIEKEFQDREKALRAAPKPAPAKKKK